MKIIHLVLGKANPDRMNGVNKVAHKLATVQTELGYDVSLWGISNDLEHNYPPRNFKTRLFQQHSQKFLLDRDLVDAMNSLSKDTVVHFHGAFIPEFFLIGKQLHNQSISFIITPHGALAKAAMDRSFIQKRLYFELFEKSLLRKALAVHLLGQSGFDHLGTLLPECRRVMIPNGQDLGELPKIERLPNTSIRFVFCGRLDMQHKGLDLLLKGFGKYKANGGVGMLDIIGDGADAILLKEIVKEEQLTEAVVFHGARFGQEKWELINQGDVFMHTSRMEGFPVAVVEAAGLGLPCIVSEETNVARYVNHHHAGIALSANTVDIIMEALTQMEALHRKGRLAVMGRNARKMVETSFDWKEIAQALYKVYACSPNSDQEVSNFNYSHTSNQNVR